MAVAFNSRNSNHIIAIYTRFGKCLYRTFMRLGSDAQNYILLPMCSLRSKRLNIIIYVYTKHI